MKTWEMIKELTENPSKKFRHEAAVKGSYVTIEEGESCNVIVWRGEQQRGQNFIVNDKETEWEEVKQPVTWQEALEAWANGATVKCEINDGSSFTFFYEGNYLEDGDETALCSEEILKRNMVHIRRGGIR